MVLVLSSIPVSSLHPIKNIKNLTC